MAAKTARGGAIPDVALVALNAVRPWKAVNGKPRNARLCILSDYIAPTSCWFGPA